MTINPFLAMFAKSPIKPIEEHIDVVTKCCKLLVPFFEATFQNDWQEACAKRDEISYLEKEADKIKRDVRCILAKDIMLPVSKSSLSELLVQQDRIANCSEYISTNVCVRNLLIPQALQDDFRSYLQRCVDASKQARKVINELESLLETGFKGREADIVIRMVEELDQIQEDTDVMKIGLFEKLYKLESQLSPVDVMFLYDVFERVGKLADFAESAGAKIDVMLSE